MNKNVNLLNDNLAVLPSSRGTLSSILLLSSKLDFWLRNLIYNKNVEKTGSCVYKASILHISITNSLGFSIHVLEKVLVENLSCVITHKIGFGVALDKIDKIIIRDV